MIRRRTKKCKKCGKDRHLFSKGLCAYCYKIEFPSFIRVKSKIKPISKKQVKRTKQYLELRFLYLKEHPMCEVEGCVHKATQIHHKKGRIGDALYNDFLAICEDCHRKVEENPEWAKENGYSVSRIKDEDGNYSNGDSCN